jgi:AcrR family transcriptional regulator
MDSPPGFALIERKRAAALPPEARRIAIVDATLPLLMELGPNITTRQIAEAAGIAEGTIFRVFPDKDALIAAAVEKALDPAPLEARLQEIDRSRPLEARLIEAVHVVQERSARLWQLMSNVGFTASAAQRDEMRRRNMEDLPAFVALFEPDDKALRFAARACARRLRALAIAGTHPALVGDQAMTAPEIVSLFLDGARKRPKGVR